MNLFLSDQEFSRMHRMRFPETGRKSFFWRRVRYRLKLSNTLQHAATLTEKGQQRQLDIAPPNCECKHPSSEPPHAHFRTDRARARTRLTPRRVPAKSTGVTELDPCVDVAITKNVVVTTFVTRQQAIIAIFPFTVNHPMETLEWLSGRYTSESCSLPPLLHVASPSTSEQAQGDAGLHGPLQSKITFGYHVLPNHCHFGLAIK